MLKYTKLLLAIFAVFVAGALHADISSVGFVHAQILELKGIDLPIPTGVTADQVNSVHYMMTQIDAVNAQNGITTNYADGPDATMDIMSAERVIADVTELVEDGPPCPEDAFCVTLTKMTTSSVFSFRISAAGNFTVDWGDGSAVETLTRTNTTETMYLHTYAVAGDYVVTIDGLATGYSTNQLTTAMRFSNSTNKAKMTSIKGDLGKIFPILNTSSTGSPRFYQTFFECSGLTEIPADLFASLSGAPVSYMFSGTFYGCTGLTSIPSGLFAGISGTPQEAMFHATFSDCTGLMSIPSGLFGTFAGPPVPYMFYGTFYGCTGLTSIADGIWDLSGITNATASHMFASTFYGCTGITSASPMIAAGSSVKLWEHFTISTGEETFFNCTKMADYASIPSAWK